MMMTMIMTILMMIVPVISDVRWEGVHLAPVLKSSFKDLLSQNKHIPLNISIRENLFMIELFEIFSKY